MDETEELFLRLNELTGRMIALIGRQDLAGLGAVIAQRGRVVGRLAELAGADGDFGARRTLAREAVRLDGQAGRAMGELFEKKRREIRQSNLSYRPLLRYNRSRFDFSAGMVIDQKK